MPLPKVTMKGLAACATRPFTTTEIGSQDAPAGTFAITWFALKETTVAFVVPNLTIIFSFEIETGFKLMPEIVTGVPTGPDSGLNELIIGTIIKLSAITYPL